MCTTNPLILIVICCIHHHIHHTSRIPFLILSFLDFVAFVARTLIFPCNFFDKRGYPASVVQVGRHCAQQIDQQLALQTSQKENNNRILIALTFHPHNHTVKSIIPKNFNLLQNDPDTGRIFLQPPLISFKCDKNIGNFLVSSAFKTSEQPGTFKCTRARCKTCPFIYNIEKLLGPKNTFVT